MKRGLITWDKTEISPAVFEERVSGVREVLVRRGLDTLVVYSELWRSNQARFFSNFMPYFNRALLIIPKDLPPTLLCGLSPRVYGWIRSVTTIEDVRPAGKFAKPLFEIAAERNWNQIGVLDLDQLPYDIHKALHGAHLQLKSVESAAVFNPATDVTELTMRRKAVALTKQILAEEMPAAVGLVDHDFVGRLERRFRRAGTEDLVTLLTNGKTVPGPPVGAKLEDHFSVSVAMEYRGHWVRMARPQTTPHVLEECRKLLESKVPARAEYLDGSYPYECGNGKILALDIEYSLEGKRLFYGDTLV